MEQVKGKTASTASRTRSLAFVGLSIALMTVSAWVSIPLGPVPFTLQTFVMMFAILVLKPREGLSAIAGYLVLGAIGLPVFSSMRGGIGIIAGPTGGFLWGFLLGAVVAFVFLHLVRPRISGANERSLDKGSKGLVIDVIAGLLFLGVSYVCGWVQLMVIASLDPVAAFATAIAPFIIIDVVKLVAAVFTARAVRRALPSK